MRFLLFYKCEVFPMKWKLCILAFLSIFILSACNTEETPTIQTKPDSQPQLYEILNEDGVYYLKYSDYALDMFHKQLELWESSDVLQMRATQYPHFSSVEEMQQKIRNKQIPFEELAQIYYTKMTNPIQIIDLDNLRDAKYPENLQFKDVKWYGNEYEFLFSNGQMSVLDDTGYDEAFRNSYTHFLNENQTIISEEQVTDRDANVIVYTNHTGTYKSVSYQLKNGSKTVFVRESYTLKHKDISHFVSESIPSSIAIFGEDGISKFSCSFRDLDSRPTTDWLLSFGFISEDIPDYGDFFQKSLTMDGGPAEAYAIETKKLFDNDPAAFITTLNQENEQIQNRVLPYLIAETRTESLAKLADHFAAYKDDPQYAGLLSIFDTLLSQRHSYEASRKGN